MKAFILFLGLIAFSFSSLSSPVDGKLPGDNLDLNAVLELFKKSKNLEDFERELNSEKSKVNNLDLNDDGFVDYIRVVNYSSGNIHLVTLQVAFSANDIQDVAVIHLDKPDDNNTVVQIVGDEALYGRDYIIEPRTESDRMAANVSHWPTVQYMYGPQYVIWVSPWYYGFYPHWHNPWRPYPWDMYYGYVYPYYGYYRPCGFYRSYHAHTFYYKNKNYSKTYYQSQKHIAAQSTLPKHKQAAKVGSATMSTGKPVNPHATNKPVSLERDVTKPVGSAERNPVNRPHHSNTVKPTRVNPTMNNPNPVRQPRVSPRTSPQRSPQIRPTPTPQRNPQVRPSSPPRSKPIRTAPQKRP